MYEVFFRRRLNVGGPAPPAAGREKGNLRKILLAMLTKGGKKKVFRSTFPNVPFSIALRAGNPCRAVGCQDSAVEP